MVNPVELFIELRTQWSTLALFEAPPLHELSMHYLRYGAAKRIRWIAQDLEWLCTNCPEDRTKPLSAEECEQAGLHLNSLYLHIRGTLDNFSWALFWQIAPDEAKIVEDKAQYMSVGLFTSTLTRILQSEANSLVRVIERSRDWDKVFKSKRDPVAHRLPLRVIPQHLNQHQAQQYHELNAKVPHTVDDFLEKCKNEREKRADDNSIEAIVAKCEAIEKFGSEQRAQQQQLYAQMGELGTFIPYFLNSGELMPLHPTIVEDCQQLSAIAKEVIAFFKSQT